ncbi:hypothetical protein CPB84DRAFT_830978 [Gymnopilus junonius]|uniref:Uncharacterized protein n=1 Tax=Gymnopilus junonius TaxID=109634 RepID=A0A9P5NRN0_GYMJU|nr:hypothetical protein CPB84DRAFT_830978 [Gymnopilus junonius]
MGVMVVSRKKWGKRRRWRCGMRERESSPTPSKPAKKLTALEEECTTAEQVLSSRFFSALAAEHKERLTSELAVLRAQRESAREVLEETKRRLVEKSDAWPVNPNGKGIGGGGVVSLQVEEEERRKEEEEGRRKFDEVVRYVKELNEYAMEMKKVLGELMGVRGPSAPPSAPGLVLGGEKGKKEEGEDKEEGEIAGDLMDVDTVNGAATATVGDGSESLHTLSRKRKRRRVDGDAYQSASESTPTSTPTHQELESILEKLIHLESIAHTLQNDLIAHDNDLREEIESSIETRFEELALSVTEHQDEWRREQKEESDRTEERFGEVRKEVEEVGGQVGELAEELGDMLLKVDEVEREVEVRRREREDSYQRVLDIERRMNEYAKQQESNAKKLETLGFALKAYTTRPPSPPASPLNDGLTTSTGTGTGTTTTSLSPSPSSTTSGPSPSAAYILQALQSSLTNALRETIQPLAEEVRRDIERIVEDRNRELFGTVWGVLQRTFVVVEQIRKRVAAGEGGEGVLGVVLGGGAAVGAGGNLSLGDVSPVVQRV